LDQGFELFQGRYFVNKTSPVASAKMMQKGKSATCNEVFGKVKAVCISFRLQDKL
jgi:hypothetical protein